MTDIVERLRSRIPLNMGPNTTVLVNPDGYEAADEIERLRKEVEYLDRLNRGTATTGEIASRLLKKFDERDAARAALEGK